jgi:P4 family phage/plasmid primase-like protien
MSATKTFARPADNLPGVIPPPLAGMTRWLLWKAVADDTKPDSKPRKVPYYVGSSQLRKGKQGSPEDLSQLVTLAVAWAAYRTQPDRWAGVGFALIDGDGVGAIDLDDCIKNGKFTEDLNVRRIVKALGQQGVYVEASPSGGGLRAIGPTDGFNTSAKPPYEAYCRDKFVTITGHVRQNATRWESIDPAIQLILGSHILRPSASLPNTAHAPRVNLAVMREPDPETPDNVARAQSALDSLDPSMGYDDWFQVGAALRSTQWERAEDLFRDWSARSAEKYSDTAFDQLWRSLEPSGGITMGTLYGMAKEVGWRGPHKPTAAPLGEDECSDVYNGRLFARRHSGTLLRVNETGQVVVFDEHEGWRIAPSPQIATRTAAQQTLPTIVEAVQEALAAGDAEKAQKLSKHHRTTQSLTRLDAMAELGWTHASMTIGAAGLDAEPDALGVQNGILDLRRGSLRPHSRNTLVTKRAGVAYGKAAKAPTFSQFLHDIQPDPEVQRLLQQIAGLTLWGRPGEHRLYFFYGTGANGKSTFVEILNYVLGDYASHMPAESLIRQDRSSAGPSPDAMKLMGARGVFASEVREGRLDEERVKQWTGGDTITARPLYRDYVHFTPSHTFIMTGNHQPSIHDTSLGIWRRILLIGFNQHIPEARRDARLPEKLRKEGSGILNWMRQGLVDYWTHGLFVPAAVKAATARYQREEDIVGQWISEQCNTGPNLSCPTGRAYLNYQGWCMQEGMAAANKNRFSRRLAERGHIKVKGDREYHGIDLKPPPGATAATV